MWSRFGTCARRERERERMKAASLLSECGRRRRRQSTEDGEGRSYIEVCVVWVHG